MRFGAFAVDAFNPAPKNALELILVVNLPVSWAFCLNASATKLG